MDTINKNPIKDREFFANELPDPLYWQHSGQPPSYRLFVCGALKTSVVADEPGPQPFIDTKDYVFHLKRIGANAIAWVYERSIITLRYFN